MSAKKLSAAAQKLAKYRSMRDFKKTQEPAGSDAPKSETSLRYLIQKHASTRLHYDFRLEWEGVLWSWAVTRGPSLDPADKRLAVHTEDHPIEYGDFEGTIPAGEYGGGTVMLWDTGTWEPMGDAQKDYAKGKIHFKLSGERLKGEWVLLRMRGRAAQEKRENWLLIKVEDKIAKPGKGDFAIENYTTSVTTNRGFDAIASGGKEWKDGKARTKKTAPLKKTSVKKTSVKQPVANAAANTKKKSAAKPDPFPAKLALQLATLVDEPPKGSEWVHEIKFDGYRALVHVEGKNVTMLTRNGHDWTHKFKGVADQFAKLGLENALIDGEVVVRKPDGTMRFHELQAALKANAQAKLHFFAFDLLYDGGENLTKKPLLERKERLRGLIPESHSRLHYSDHFTQSGEDVLHNACRIALEGIISKRADAPYRSGRVHDWLKSKCIHEQEFAIGGYTLPSNASKGIGALLLGYYEDGKFTYCGRVGTGFDQETSRELRTRLEKTTRKTMPYERYSDNGRRGTGWKRGVIWVEPKLVCQVVFTEWTEEGSLRHPSFQGMREDKKASQVVREREADVRAMETAPKARVPRKGGGTENFKATATPLKPATPKTPNVPPAKSRAKDAPEKIGGIMVTHPERLVFKTEGISKRVLAEYYASVAPWMLPHVAGRPVSLMRCPDGTAGQCFFQRHASPGMPDAIRVVDIDPGRKVEEYMTLDGADGVIAAVQMGSIELHVWGAEADDVERPNRIVFDFDPDEAIPFTRVKQAAKDMRARLSQLGLESFLKTTGGKGLHVVLPFKKGPDWVEVKNFARAMCTVIAQDNPKHFTVNMRKAERKGKIYLDYLRNERSASAVAPYSVRARTGAPVAMPIEWSALTKLKAGNQFTLANAGAHLKRRKTDPWKDIGNVKQDLPSLA